MLSMQLLITVLGLRAHREFQFLLWSLGRDPCQLQLLEGAMSWPGYWADGSSDPKELEGSHLQPLDAEAHQKG